MTKRLLQINTTLNSGSTGRIAEQIALMAQRQGWECVLAHGPRYVNKSQIKSIQIGSKIGNYIHAVMGMWLGMHGLGSTIATYSFLRKVKKFNPDVIHIHNIHGYYLNIKVLFNYLSKSSIPVVWTLHDCWSFTGHCTHFDLANCEKWKIECGTCPLQFHAYKSIIIDRSRENYLLKKKLYAKQKELHVITVSNWLKELASQSILKQFPIVTIHNGIDVNTFKPTDSDVRKKIGVPEGKYMLLGVVASGMGNGKGLREFINLSKIEEYQVVLVGLSEKAKSLFPSNVICLGRTNSQKELAMYYSAADVFVNPTYNESFSLTNVEAQACGTPVVTYKAGGTPETVSMNTGFTIERGDFNSMLQAIKKVLSEDKLKYSNACRQWAISGFNKDERFSDYLKLYERLLFEKERK